MWGPGRSAEPNLAIYSIPATPFPVQNSVAYCFYHSNTFEEYTEAWTFVTLLSTQAKGLWSDCVLTLQEDKIPNEVTIAALTFTTSWVHM